MFQRKQTLWLIIAAISMAVCMFLPMASYRLALPDGTQLEATFGIDHNSTPDLQEAVGKAFGKCPVPVWPLVVCSLGTLLLSIFALTLYKKRVLQMRVVAGALALCFVYIALVFIWGVDSYGEWIAQCTGALRPRPEWEGGSYLSLVALVFLIMAYYAIRGDEAKVRAADRLR